MEITMKMLTIINLKLFKITGHSSVATEADRKYLPKREMGNLPNSYNPFLIAIKAEFSS